MRLSGKRIFAEGILQGAEEANIQQQGVDVRIKCVSKLDKVGAIPKDGKTILPTLTPITPCRFTAKGADTHIIGWMLAPGIYDVELLEGVTMPNKRCGFLKTRSSLVRQGSEIKSGLFDAGFNSENMGCMIEVGRTVIIAYGARVAQLVVDESDDVENLYDGQFQGDKQRINKE